MNAFENLRGRLTVSVRVSRDVPKLVRDVSLGGFYSQEREERRGLSGRGRICNEKRERLLGDSAASIRNGARARGWGWHHPAMVSPM